MRTHYGKMKSILTKEGNKIPLPTNTKVENKDEEVKEEIKEEVKDI